MQACTTSAAESTSPVGRLQVITDSSGWAGHPNGHKIRSRVRKRTKVFCERKKWDLHQIASALAGASRAVEPAEHEVELLGGKTMREGAYWVHVLAVVRADPVVSSAEVSFVHSDHAGATPPRAGRVWAGCNRLVRDILPDQSQVVVVGLEA